MNSDYLKGIIEEILYIWGEPIDINDLSKIIFDAEKSEIRKAINEMVDDRKLKSSGLIIKNMKINTNLQQELITKNIFQI